MLPIFGILGSFQKNWVSSELRKYQDLLLHNVPSCLRKDLSQFFQYQLGIHYDISISDRSVKQSHIDPLSLSEYQRNSLSPLDCVDGTLRACYVIHRRYEKVFDHEQVSWLTQVYYPKETLPTCQCFTKNIMKLMF